MKFFNKKNIKYIPSLFLILVIFAVPNFSHALLLYPEASKREVGLDERFKVSIYLEAVGERVNTIESVFSYDPLKLQLTDIEDGGSIVGVWILKPEINPKGEVRFSGVIPGGFEYLLKPLDSKKYPGHVVSFYLKPILTGDTKVKISDSKVYLHDGKGTIKALSEESLDFFVTEASFENPEPEEIVADILDITPPEYFDFKISRDEKVFDGKYFAVFQTTDQESGINYYEIKEGKREWIKASSPYLLQNQRVSDRILVKAVDRAGNVRIATSSRDSYPQGRDIGWSLWIILIIGGILLVSLRGGGNLKPIFKL